MAKYNCIICGSPSMDRYCFRHTEYPINKTPVRFKKKNIEKAKKDVEETEKMWELFLKIWENRPHISAVSNTPLGKEPKSYMFDHLLEKSIYPEFKYEKENIILVTGDEHSLRSAGFALEKHQQLINKARKQFLYNDKSQ